MAKIYAAPVECGQRPEIVQPFNFSDYERANKAYEAKIIEFAKKHSTCSEAGEIISFPVADGHACYVVMSLKPVALIHLDISDGYQFQYAHRLTASDVREKIRQAKAMREIFSKKS